jgi:histidinol dehydrogenase
MNINIRRWSEMAEDERKKILSRSEIDIAEAAGTVSQIIADVRKRGDSALKELNHRFDGSPKDAAIRIPEKDFDDAADLLSPEIKKALEYSVENVRRYHADQVPDGLVWKENPTGNHGRGNAPAHRIGGLLCTQSPGQLSVHALYEGRAAQIAGVPRIAAVSPPDKHGKVDPACLYTAGLCGVREVYAMGGAQAWAALAYGTESVKKVDKCLGPGSKYVAAAQAPSGRCPGLRTSGRSFRVGDTGRFHPRSTTGSPGSACGSGAWIGLGGPSDYRFA